MHLDYAVCGLRVASELPIAALPAWNGSVDHSPDIVIQIGAVPAQLDAPNYVGPLLQIGRDGTVLHVARGIATYLIQDGRHITVAPAPGAMIADVQLFLLATPFGALFHQRGLFPLHASTVMIAGRTIALAGHSGAGKSTLAASLLAAGGQLLADDLTVIDIAAQGRPRVLPSFPQQKLWQDSLEALGLPQGQQVRQGTTM